MEDSSNGDEFIMNFIKDKALMVEFTFWFLFLLMNYSVEFRQKVEF